MDEGQLSKLEALTAKYANGGSPSAYVNAATQMVGKVGMIICLALSPGSLACCASRAMCSATGLMRGESRLACAADPLFPYVWQYMLHVVNYF